MDYTQEAFDKLSLADLIALENYCDQKIDMHEKNPKIITEKQVREHWGPLSCIAMCQIGYRIAELLVIPEDGD